MAQVIRLLAERARSQPDETAFSSGADGRSLTWRDLAGYAERVRALARDRGLAPRTRVALLTADPLDFARGYLGLLSAGMTVAPIDPRLTGSELSAIVARLRAGVLLSAEISDVDGVERWRTGAVGPVPVFTSRTRPSTSGYAARPAVLLLSSGTTGTPKGVPLSEWQLLHAARRVAAHHGFGPGERGYSPLPLFHVNAQVMGLLATLVSGSSLVLDRRFTADQYWDVVAQWRPTWLNAVPAVLAALTRQPAPPERVAAGIRFARSASAPLPVATLESFAAHTGIGVLETYGMTEAAGQITANPLDPACRRPGSVGLPVGVGLRVLGADGRPAASGMVALRGRAIAATYLDLDAERPERRRPARDAHGWLPTGDLGSVDADGFVHLDGRADDVINRGGEKVHPQEVEAVLLGHPAVRSAAVVGAPHDRLGQVPVAFVVAGPYRDRDELLGALTRMCANRLARYKRPVRIEIADSLPTGPTGKVLRRAVTAR
jgi:acyl-CoA synthetase (AMP-forming)/AMP-acid ligase II